MAPEEIARVDPEAVLARLKERERPRLRIYIGAAPGVGKTYAMLQEAHALRARGLDVVVGFVETYNRPDTQAQLKDLEVVARRVVERRRPPRAQTAGLHRRRARAHERAGQP